MSMNLSFAGCGFLGIYHVGVAVCFRKYAPHLLLDKISGASAGAIAACCLLCDLPIGEITSDVLRVAIEARTRTLGPFSPSFNIQNLLLEGLSKFLPDDAHIRVSGKLHISLTRVRDGKNIIVSQYDSKEDLLQALLASAFVPLFSGIFPPKFKGVRYMDGGFSDNLPTLDENTITVSPFCGESDICPRDDSSQLFHINLSNTSIELSRQNVYRFGRILFPPKPEILSNMCKQGFDDALRFLHRNNLINCTRCLSVQSTFVVSETIEESIEYDPQCKECKIHRQEALVSNMPETVLSIFQDAIDSANKGLINWLFKHRGMKLLSILTLPYTIPVDIMYATFSKLKDVPRNSPKLVIMKISQYNLVNYFSDGIESRNLQSHIMGRLTARIPRQPFTNHRFVSAAPSMGINLLDIGKNFMSQLSFFLKHYRPKRHHSANISCQLALMEYGTHNAPDDNCDGNKINVNFTLNLNEDSKVLAHAKHHPSKVLSRASSFSVSKIEGDDDTFDQILQVTSHHDTVMAYYYLDENNEVKMTEIFDVTESDSAAVQTAHEKETNAKLEFEDDWDDSPWPSRNILEGSCYDDQNSFLAGSDISLEDCSDSDYHVMSDPESEWNGTYKVEEPDEEQNDTRPESDQPTMTPAVIQQLDKPYRIPTSTYQEDVV